MKFFVIPPLSALELMHEGTAGYYCLCNLYIKYPEYRRFFLNQRNAGKFILLDNGAAEHDLVTETALLNITCELRPDLVIPPDILLNKEETLKSFYSFIKRFEDRKLYDYTRIFACPQASNVKDWLNCYEEMMEEELVVRIGLSKITIPYCFNGVQIGEDRLIKESRWRCVEELKRRNFLNKDIHCLGAGDMREFEYYKDFPQIVSTDSCNTVWSAMNGISFEDGNFERFPTPRDYFERKIEEESLKIAKKNTDWMKKSLGNVAQTI